LSLLDSRAHFLTHAWVNRHLLLMMMKRTLNARYKNSVFGIAWIVINPMIKLTIYTLVFHSILNIKWGSQEQTGPQFALYIYIGMIVFSLFSESMLVAPHVLISHRNMIKKIDFPIEILPWVHFCAAVCDAVVGFVIWTFAYFIVNGIPPITIFLLPIIFLPFLLITMGLNWIISASSVFVKDINQLTQFAIAALLFLSPIFYPLSAVPGVLHTLMLVNPLSFEIEMLRGILIEGMTPSWSHYAIYLGIGMAIYGLGYRWYRSVQDEFADVL
jgi:lipopolysaccharide transport system permease protein